LHIFPAVFFLLRFLDSSTKYSWTNLLKTLAL
jgi:hypothetical protein